MVSYKWDNYCQKMGNVGSKIFSYGKRIAIRYNAENRAYKFLDKGKLPPAPRHEVSGYKEVPLSRETLEDIHCKNIQLNEYLKKVYLTSTSEIIGTPAKTKRPKPKKENERLGGAMFFEPKLPASGCCTLSSVVQILLKFDPQSKDWSVDAIAKKYNLDKKDVVLLVTYYSLYRHERFDFMNQKPPDSVPLQYDKVDQIENAARKIDSK